MGTWRGSCLVDVKGGPPRGSTFRLLAVWLLALMALLPEAAWAQPQGAVAAPRKPEFGALPLAGGDSDYGLGFGGFASYALPDPKNPPFVWGLELGGFITFRSIDDELVHPYQDLYLLFRHLQLMNGRLRVESRLSWTREATLNYFGIGNASVAPSKDESLSGFRYVRTHPEFYARARYTLVGPWQLELGQYFALNGLNIDADARLAADYAAPPEDFASSFKTQKLHGIVRTDVSAMFDTRDNELAPTRGQFHEMRLRVSPNLGRHVPFGYEELSVNLRFFQALGTKRVIFAARLVGDVLLGDVPFYEMSRYDETNAIGGVKGLRGVLAQRYYGKVKVFSNLELRFRLFEFRVFKKTYTLGAVSFFDSGRVWSDLSPSRQLDGTGIGLKYGVGGGLRLMQGTTFVVRGDIAWSPDARPIGAYVTAGHMF